MPVKIPDGLPASKVLMGENVFVMPESRAFRQDIRPLRVAVVNIMPMKSVTETQLLRLLGNSPLQVSVTFLHPRSHRCKTTPPEHLAAFYKGFAEVKRERFDCLIVTGAPVETLDFSEVSYWDELRGILDWSLGHVYSSLHICWGAQAGLYHYYGIPKRQLSQKVFGVFEHKAVGRKSPLLYGFDDVFLAPHSRHTDVRKEDIIKAGSVSILSESSVAGVYIASARNDRQIFVTGHPEYDQLTLREEYERDKGKGLDISLPENYFPGDDPSRLPLMSWRGHANLLFGNWLNFVYQTVPFDLNDIEPLA